MKNGSFVFDAHTGFWDASKENCKNRFGEAFIESFYAFHKGWNPVGDAQWAMDYEKQFRKVDPDGTSRKSLLRVMRTCPSSPPRCLATFTTRDFAMRIATWRCVREPPSA